jgi:hypothetical protein
LALEVRQKDLAVFQIPNIANLLIKTFTDTSAGVLSLQTKNNNCTFYFSLPGTFAPVDFFILRL